MNFFICVLIYKHSDKKWFHRGIMIIRWNLSVLKIKKNINKLIRCLNIDLCWWESRYLTWLKVDSLKPMLLRLGHFCFGFMVWFHFFWHVLQEYVQDLLWVTWPSINQKWSFGQVLEVNKKKRQPNQSCKYWTIIIYYCQLCYWRTLYRWKLYPFFWISWFQNTLQSSFQHVQL